METLIRVPLFTQLTLKIAQSQLLRSHVRGQQDEGNTKILSAARTFPLTILILLRLDHTSLGIGIHGVVLTFHRVQNPLIRMRLQVKYPLLNLSRYRWITRKLHFLARIDDTKSLPQAISPQDRFHSRSQIVLVLNEVCRTNFAARVAFVRYFGARQLY